MIPRALQSLCLIGEERTEENFMKVQKFISDAQQIHFLGFGYATENLDRLSVETMVNKYIKGTSRGLMSRERRQILGYFQQKKVQLFFDVGEDDSAWNNSGDDVLEYLRKGVF